MVEILLTTSDTTANPNNGKSFNIIKLINVIQGISTEDRRLLEVKLRKDTQFEEYQRLHSEKKKLKEKLGTCLRNNCVLIGDLILNFAIETNLSNDL